MNSQKIIMTILKTEILGSKIEINYKADEKEKLIDLIDRFKKRLLEFKDLQGKVTDNKILFLAALKAEDHIFDLNEKFLVQNKEKIISKNLSFEVDSKIKEIINLKDQILILNKENKRLKDLNEKALEEINRTNNKLSTSINIILLEINNNEFN